MVALGQKRKKENTNKVKSKSKFVITNWEQHVDVWERGKDTELTVAAGG